ncbi:MAG: hypothetical protein ACE5DK_07565 [Paracoccaceae bacterium]
MLAALFLVTSGLAAETTAGPAMPLGEGLATLGVLVFAANAFQNAR